MLVRHRAFHDGRVGPFVTFVDHIRSYGAPDRRESEVGGDGAEANSSDRMVCGIGRRDGAGADDDG
jgi:hypothetical protein